MGRRTLVADRDPVGESLQIASADGTVSSLTIVGVVADNRAAQSSLVLAENGPLLYRPFDQAPSPFATYFVRTQAHPVGMVAPVRQLVAKLVPSRPLSTRVVADLVELQLGGVRTTAVQLTGIAIVGLFIAVVGVHGLLAYNVNRRIREIGIRRVLGATTSGVLGLVLGEAARLTAIGVALGLVLAWIAMRRFQPATEGIGQDQAVYAAAAVLALIAAVLSAYVPARRAASVSPQEALRS
jgi:ABC-type antimicrobial peptide transport system permease subunit